MFCVVKRQFVILDGRAAALLLNSGCKINSDLPLSGGAKIRPILQKSRKAFGERLATGKGRPDIRGEGGRV